MLKDKRLFVGFLVNLGTSRAELFGGQSVLVLLEKEAVKVDLPEVWVERVGHVLSIYVLEQPWI